VTNLPNYDEIMKGRRFAEQKAFIEKLKFYVDFVNQKTKEKQNP